MAAELIDPAELTEETHELPTDPNEATQEEIIQEFSDGQQTPEPEYQGEEPTDDDLPEKYRGKSAQELARMHQEAEQLLGRQSNEVGELRKTVDNYILSQLQAADSATQEPEDEVDFFVDPDTAVNKAIEKHPAVQQAAKQAKEYQHTTAVAQLQQRHPDMGEILTDPKFMEWVQASKVRQQLFQQADQGYDADVADELLTLYKERQSVARQTAQVETTARKQQARAAQTGTQGQGSGGSSKRIYRRADIIKLMKTDPDRYEALSPELMQAYAEGRVR